MMVDTVPSGATPSAGAGTSRAASVATPAVDRDTRNIAGAHQVEPTLTQKLADPKVVEDDLAWLINERRRAEGLSPLLMVDAIRPVAREWAQAMANAGKISHRSDLAVYPAAHPEVNWALAGENVGVTGSFVLAGADALAVLDQAFWDSQLHKDNVLGPFNHISIGAFDTGSELYVSVAFVDYATDIPGGYLPTSALHDASLGLWKVSVDGPQVAVRGWADDPDSRHVAIQLTLDGEAVAMATAYPRQADTLAVADRPTRVWQRPFSTVFDAAPGPHEVCAQSVSVGFGLPSPRECRTIRVKAPVVATRGGEVAFIEQGSEPSFVVRGYSPEVLLKPSESVGASTDTTTSTTGPSRPSGSPSPVLPSSSVVPSSTGPSSTATASGPSAQSSAPTAGEGADIEVGSGGADNAIAYRVSLSDGLIAARPVGLLTTGGHLRTIEASTAAKQELAATVSGDVVDYSAAIVPSADGGEVLAGVTRTDSIASAFGPLADLWDPVIKTFDEDAPIKVATHVGTDGLTRWWILGRHRNGRWAIVDSAGNRLVLAFAPSTNASVDFEIVDVDPTSKQAIAVVSVEGRKTRRGTISWYAIDAAGAAASGTKSAQPLNRESLIALAGEGLIDFEPLGNG